jgi:hypothetical protein
LSWSLIFEDSISSSRMGRKVTGYLSQFIKYSSADFLVRAFVFEPWIRERQFRIF